LEVSNRFDTDGSRTWRTDFVSGIKTLYLWPQSLSVCPLNEQALLPVFVVGCGHSGTTLLATVLGRSEELLQIGYESSAFLPSRGYATSREVGLCWQNLALQTGHRGFVEKTPKHVHCISRIRKVFPRARIIGITRDGRDVMASFMGRGMAPGFAVHRWVEDNKALIAAVDAADVFRTTYEAIVADPEAEIARICDWLGIAFSKAMLTDTGTGYAWIRGGTMGKRAIQTAQPIHDGSGRWLTELSDEQVGLFWRQARDMMAALGYPDRDA
jgi:hypothetical protein